MTKSLDDATLRSTVLRAGQRRRIRMPHAKRFDRIEKAVDSANAQICEKTAVNRIQPTCVAGFRGTETTRGTRVEVKPRVLGSQRVVPLRHRWIWPVVLHRIVNYTSDIVDDVDRHIVSGFVALVFKFRCNGRQIGKQCAGGLHAEKMGVRLAPKREVVETSSYPVQFIFKSPHCISEADYPRSDECEVNARGDWEKVVFDHRSVEELPECAPDIVKHGAALYRHAHSWRQSFAVDSA